MLYTYNQHNLVNLLHSKNFYIITTGLQFSQFNSVTQSCPTFCDPMDCSMPCFSQLSEPTQTHVH